MDYQHTNVEDNAIGNNPLEASIGEDDGIDQDPFETSIDQVPWDYQNMDNEDSYNGNDPENIELARDLLKEETYSSFLHEFQSLRLISAGKL